MSEAKERGKLHSDGATISYDGSLRYQAELLGRVYPRARGELEERLGWKLRAKPHFFLIEDSGEFERMGGSAPVAAFVAFPKGNIVMNFGSITPHFVLLSQTLRHELCHLFLHENIRAGALPKWLDEGVSDWVNQASQDAVTRRLDRLAASFALSRQAVPLASLAREFPKGGIAMAYEESESFVEYVVARYGEAGLLRVLNLLAKGQPVGRAFELATTRPLAALESEWRAELQERARWLTRAKDAFDHLKDGGTFLKAAIIERHRGLGALAASLAAFFVLLKLLGAKRRRV